MKKSFRCTIIYFWLCIVLFVGCSIEQETVSEPDVQEHKVCLNLEYSENWFFSKYNVDIYIDDEKLGTIQQGENKKYTFKVADGSHKLLFTKEDEKSFATEVKLKVKKSMNKAFKLSANRKEITVEKEDVSDSVETPETPEVSETPQATSTPIIIVEPDETPQPKVTAVPQKKVEPKATTKPKNKYKLKVEQHKIPGAPKKTNEVKKFVKAATKVIKSYRCKKVYFEYQSDGTLYVEIKCKNDYDFVVEIADRLALEKENAEYQEWVWLSFIDQSKSEDEAGIVIANIDLE